MPASTMDILLVEDSLNDILITRRAFARGVMSQHRLSVVRDGQEALDFLYRRGAFGKDREAPRPDLILLDLNLPRVDGYEVLRTIKSDPHLQYIPVVVLTTSEHEEDITTCYNLGANSFVPKPVEYERFLRMIQVLYDYWWDVARLPAPARRALGQQRASKCPVRPPPAKTRADENLPIE